MEVFRIHGATFAALDGTGAALHGARWNHPGSPVVYAALTFEGAILEQLVHAGIGRLPRNRVVSRIRIPETATVARAENFDDGDEAWRDEAWTRDLGSTWLAHGSGVGLIVPSAVARPFGFNILLNPAHGDFAGVEVLETLPVAWDPRLLR